MSSPTPSDEAAVRAALLERVFADRLAGEVRSDAAYRELFPGHHALVERVLAALAAGDPEASAGGAALVLGHYRLLKELGRGGQGVVYLAEDGRLRRRVALKVLPALGPRAAELARRFQREAEVLSRLDHPGLCTIHEAGAADGTLFIAMRFVEGETLAARIEAARTRRSGDTAGRSPSSARREACATLELFEKCALALHHAHEAGVVHRDVKPNNIMIDRRGEPVILDFGLAREQDDATLTLSGEFLGTPAYASPELLAGARGGVDRRTDVFSLGVSLYEALTGRRPFEAPTREGLFQAILTREPPDPRALAPGISSDLKVVLATALAKEVGRRYATAHDLALDLRSASLGEPIRARPLSRGRRLLRWARRAPARAALVLLLALGVPVLSSLGTYLLTARDEIAIGHGVLLRSRVDRAIDRGFMALLPVFGEAEPAFREALELDPGNLEATAGLTLYLLRLHERDQVPRLAEARVLIDQAERRIGRHPDLLRLRLLCAEAAGDGAQAEALRLEIGTRRSALGCVIESTPCWSLAVAIPPNIAASKDLYRLASEACALAAPHRLYHYLLQGVAASTLKDPAETTRIADVILDRWGDDPDACLVAAGVLMAPNNARARRLIEEKVLPFDAERPVAWVLLGLRGESLARITECIERGLELGGPNRWVLCRLGYARLSMGAADAGLRAFQEALDLGQATSEELVGRGRARWRLGDLAGAESDFRSALGLWEGYYGAEYYLASLLMETGRPGEALPYLQHCIEVDDLQPESWRRLAQVLEELGRDDEARATWERATQRLPGDPELWNSMAWFLIEPARPAEGWSPDLAAFAARCSLALTDPDPPEVLNTLGVALYRQGDDERALEVLRSAVAARAEKGLPQIVEDQGFIACAAARLGRREEAVMALEAARGLLAGAPEDRDAEAALAEAEASVAAAVLAQPREQQ